MTDAIQTFLAGLVLLFDGFVTLCGSLVVLYKALVAKAPKRVPKSILISGASSGIGESLAVEYARSGVTLGLIGRNKGMRSFLLFL